MHIKIPVCYSCEVLEPRKKKRTEKQFGEWLDADIPEVSPDEAPVALRWTVPEGAFLRQIHGLDGVLNKDGLTIETRWYDGSHWMPFFEAENQDRNNADVLSAEAMKGHLKEGHFYKLPFRGGVDWRIRDFLSGEIQSINPDNYREVDFEGRDALLKRLDESLSNLIVLDGQVWHRRREPVYKDSFQRTEEGRVGFFPLVFVPEDFTNDGGYKRELSSLRRIDQFDEMRDQYPAELAESWHDGVEILIPESLTYDPEGLGLMAASENALDWSRGMELWPKEQGYAFYDLRDAFKLAKESADENGVPEVEALDDLAPAALAYAGTFGTGSDKLKLAAERYLNRALDFDAPAALAM